LALLAFARHWYAAVRADSRCRGSVRAQLRDKYGITVTASTEADALRAAQQSVWRELADTNPDEFAI